MRIWAPLLLAVVPLVAAAEPTDADRLRRENAALQARVEALEQENAELREALGMSAAPLVGTPAAELDGGPLAAPGVRTRPMQLEVTHGSRAEHALTMAAANDGFVATIETQFSGGIYRRVSSMRWDVDGETHESAVRDYDATRITTGPAQRRIRRDHERVEIAVSRETLAAIAAGASVRGVLGRTTFTVPTAQRMTMRALLVASDDATASRPASTEP